MADRLPKELIAEILTRLPVKALLKFRCVCKSWGSLISSPKFITSKLNQTIHLNKINNTDTHIIGRYINANEEGGGEEGRYSVIIYDGSCFIELENPILYCASQLHIFGSCNGLVCLSDNIFDYVFKKVNNLILWNPSIRKSMRLPMSSIGIDSHGLREVVDGYGFDSKTNDYKVVRIAYINDFPDAEVELYSLNRGCWRRIYVVGPHHRFTFAPLPSQVFVNGIVHWVGGDLDADYDISILTFDMSSEVFCKMMPPAAPPHGWMPTRLAVSVLGESLCLGHFDSLVSKVSIWVMKEYGVVQSWSKLFAFDVDEGFGRFLGFRRTGDLRFFKRNDRMFSINLESQQAKDLGIWLSGNPEAFYAVPHVAESLVLL
ncbi:F-box/kelch-repeat protein At3g23880-like [Cornus florida]|uniref:F-box/kelch-repeat protein At3g23880-like n=1 Tax=Cornus florida TaxID=4283 RepID=UPI0028A00B80|nr:F-box/kelch-repeat protein At3g23880-like [Cornus florida]